MNREFDNGFDQEEERRKGFGRRRDTVSGTGADSDKVSRERSGSNGQEMRGAGADRGAGSGNTPRPRTAPGADRPSRTAPGADHPSRTAPGTDRSSRTAPVTDQSSRTAPGAGRSSRAPSSAENGYKRAAADGRPAGASGAGRSGERPRYTGEAGGARPVYTGEEGSSRVRGSGEKTAGRPRYTGETAGNGRGAGNVQGIGNGQGAGNGQGTGNSRGAGNVRGTDKSGAGRVPRSAGDGTGVKSRPAYNGGAGYTDGRSGDGAGYAAGRPGAQSGYTGGRSTERPRFTGDRTDGRPAGTKPGERPRYMGEGKESRAASGLYGTGETAGRANSRSYTDPDDGGFGRSRTAAGRNGDKGSGRRAAREAAAADPAAAEIRHRRKMIIVMIILEILFLFLIGGYRYAQNKMNLIQPSSYKPGQVTNPNIDVSKAEEMKGYWTIALFGVDSRNNSVGKGNNADVIIICNVNQDNGEIKLVSVFRDSYMSVSENGLYNKINQAYFLGGPEQAVEALNRNMDLQIDDFATFNWKAVVDAVNILGGVDVELSKAEFYYINAFITETVEATGVGSHQLKQAGLNHLDGVQAVAYARLRKMDTDFARTERQREIIDLCFQKLKKSDFSVVNNVMEVVFPQILSSITIDDIIPAARNLTKYTIADTMGFPSARSDANMGKKGACVIPQTLESNVTLLHQFLFGDENYQPSDMVKKISAKISADTGMYNEAKPIDHVGTDGGYIPKPTEATKATKSDEEKEKESESSTSETKESIIDGETDLELETDEFGNVLDPPEDDIFGRPGESSSSAYPGRPGESSSGSSLYPGGDSTGNGQATGPGSITYPGQDSTRGTTAAYPGSTTGTTAAYPGSTRGTTAAYPGSTTGTTAAYPGSTRGSTAAYPGSTADEYVPEGPGSVIIGPGN